MRRSEVPANAYHRFVTKDYSGKTTQTMVNKLADGRLLVTTIIDHKGGKNKDIYQTWAELDKDGDVSDIDRQWHFKEPREGKGNATTELVKRYWPKFAKTTTYSETAAKERMKKFWEWMVEQGYYVKKGTQKRTGSSPLVLPIPSAFNRG